MSSRLTNFRIFVIEEREQPQDSHTSGMLAEFVGGNVLTTSFESLPEAFGATAIQEQGESLLTARRIRGTHQLIEWIMGRLDRVEVIAPVSLRDYIVEHIDAMQARYT